MAEEKKIFRILVTPLNGHGHINACHGLCEELRDRGHQVVFAIDRTYQGRLTVHGFEERYIDPPEDSVQYDSNGKKIEFWQEFVSRNSDKYSLPIEECVRQLWPLIFRTMFEMQNATEDQYVDIIDEIKPDLIIYDGYVCFAPIIKSGRPWIWLYSAAPLAMLCDPRLPPYFSGLPYNGDKKEWEKFRMVVDEAMAPILETVNVFCIGKGCPSLNGRLHPYSPYLNVYMWPKELRYPEMNDLPENILGVDCLVRNESNQKKVFEIPEILQGKPGKLIFFSMGSFGTCNLKLMKRLVEILSKSPNRFIVSKGPLEYELASNMYGESFLPQMEILPLVDMVITHGGNNTITETFYHGKKMLVMPTFFDQLDNAQRIAEVGLGARLNPFTCTEDELLKTIEMLADDDHLTKRMAKIGERIRGSLKETKKITADLMEKIINQNS